ncbi:MAG: cytochrome b [Aquabacterium sp.]
MPAPNNLQPAPAPARYGRVAISLHWLMAVGLLAMMAVGTYMAGLDLSPSKLKLYNQHKWAGVVLLLLAMLRLAWRLTHRPPAAAPMPAWQARAAGLAHGLLYVLLFAVPLAGWAYSSAAGFPVVLFGVLPLPDLLPVDKSLAAAVRPLHRIAAWTLLALIVLHAAAALKHHFIDRDGLLRRMWP